MTQIGKNCKERKDKQRKVLTTSRLIGTLLVVWRFVRCRSFRADRTLLVVDSRLSGRYDDKLRADQTLLLVDSSFVITTQALTQSYNFFRIRLKFPLLRIRLEGPIRIKNIFLLKIIFNNASSSCSFIIVQYKKRPVHQALREINSFLFFGGCFWRGLKLL